MVSTMCTINTELGTTKFPIKSKLGSMASKRQHGSVENIVSEPKFVDKKCRGLEGKCD